MHFRLPRFIFAVVIHRGMKRTHRHFLIQALLLSLAGGMTSCRDTSVRRALARAETFFPDTTNKYFANSLFELGLLYSNHHMYGDAISVFI